MMMPLFINGRFLAKKITGTERFAREIVWALDALFVEKNINPEVRIIAPQDTPAPAGLSRIAFTTYGSLKGHAWEQWDLYNATKQGTLLSLCNCGPVLHPHQLTVIHDALVFRMPDNFSWSYGTFHRTLGRILTLRSRIATVSEFSRSELAKVLLIREEDILVIPNGHEHILRVAAQHDVLDRLALKDRPYFLFVGSPVPNKNLARAIEAFIMLNRPDVAFVIVGATKANVFKGQILNLPPNVFMPGRMTDGEIVALYRNATAMIFPSLYEGFGIPPLEAMTLGCPLIASDIPPVREVCADSALYFNPFSPETIAARMTEILTLPKLRAQLSAKGRMRYLLFSWKNSAKTSWDAIQPMLPIT